MRYLLLLGIAGLLFSCSKDEDDDTPSMPDPGLTFELKSSSLDVIKRSELHANLTTEDISIFDPVHQKNKNYRAFPLKDVLEYAYGQALDSTQNYIFLFEALDGFKDTTTYNMAMETGGYIAVEDLDVNGTNSWEPVALENNNDPYPFYVVWKGPNQNPTTDNYPWPYQLSVINLVE